MSLVKATLDITPLEAAISVLGNILPDSIELTARASAKRVEPQIRSLAEAPRAVVRPIQWKSPKQRKYYLAKVAKRDAQGKIIPYQRTGEIPQGWNVDAVRVDDSTLVGLSNTVPGAEFVYGLVNDMSYQQPFHRITGWAGADDLTTVGLELFQDDFNKSLTNNARRLIEVRL